MENVLQETCSFLPRVYVAGIGWPVLHEKVILTGDWSFARLFYQR